MTPERLKEIVMMDSSATPGPWSRVDNENQHWGLRRVHGPAVRVGGFTIATDLTIEEGWQIESDCNFIAAARTAVPDLLAHVAALTARAEVAETALNVAREQLQSAEQARNPVVAWCIKCDHAFRSDDMVTPPCPTCEPQPQAMIKCSVCSASEGEGSEVHHLPPTCEKARHEGH